MSDTIIGSSIVIDGEITGTAPVVGNASSPSMSLISEYNLAPHTGTSELHLLLHARLVFVSDAQPLEDSFREGYPGISSWLVYFPESSVGVQADLGLLKRWYLVGPIFTELGAGLAFSRYFIDSFRPIFTDYEVTMQVDGGGLMGLAGLGLQMSPRWILRLNAGYRALITFPTIEVNGEPCSDIAGSICDAEGGADYETGKMVNLNLIYTY